MRTYRPTIPVSSASIIPTLWMLTLAMPAAAVQIAAGDILALEGDIGVYSTGSLYRVDPVTGGETLVSAGSYTDFDVNAAGEIYAVDGTAVVQIDPATGLTTPVSAGGLLANPRFLSTDSAGIVYVADQQDVGTEANLIRLTRSSGGAWQQDLLNNVPLLSSTGYIYPKQVYDLDTLPDGSPVVAAVTNTVNVGLVSTIDLQLGTENTVLAGDIISADDSGIGIGPAGEVVVAAGTFEQIVAVDPETGSFPWAIVPGVIDPDGLSIVFRPRNIAFDAQGRALVSVTRTDYSPPENTVIPGRILRINRNEDLAIGTNPEFLGTRTYREVQIVPVPEPATLPLLATGLALLARERRRL